MPNLYQLIFCDFSMPQMDGLQCIRELKNIVTEWNSRGDIERQQDSMEVQMPLFCLITAYQSEELSEISKSPGLFNVMIKPIFKD